MIQSRGEFLFQKQKEFFAGGKTLPLIFRRRQLERFSAALVRWEPRLLAALSADLGKAPFEGYATELGMLRGEIGEALRHLDVWAAPEKVPGPLLQFPSRGWRYPEPKGCVLILSPWNYPVQLTLAPLISAIAAGNCAILALPPDAPKTSAALEKMIRELYPETYIGTVLGTIPQNTALFRLPFDHIFFTGSPKVGKIVMAAAAEHLTPVTLELGGKSPCIVEEDADIPLAARRIVWGKCMNAGQTCVAPDYVLVHQAAKDRLVREIIYWERQFYPGSLKEKREFPRIINEKHFDRLLGLLEGQKILWGGQHCRKARKIALTLVDAPAPDSPVMEEEIFGPILPIIPYSHLEETLAFVRSRPKPLALYLFTGDREWGRKVMQQASFGGGCINDTIVHLSTPKLPFGGVGNSGMGSCHGKAGFDTFTHRKSVLERSERLDIPFRYPPFGKKLALLKKLMP